jgi:hypothetical protein
MPKSQNLFVLGCLGAALLSPVTAGAGVVVHMSSRDLPNGEAKDHQVFYAQNGMFRIDRLDPQGRIEQIQLIRDGVIWDIDVPQRTFRKFDKSLLAAQQSGMQSKMRAYLDKLPPERRAQLEQRLGAMQQQTFTVTDSGHSEHVGSYSCEIWQVARQGKVLSENCIAPKSSLKGGDELVDAAHEAAAAASDALAGTPQAAHAMGATLALYNRMDGFPVLVRRLSGGKAESEDTVTSIDTQSLPADKFAIPKGFTEKTLGASGEED